MEANYRLFPPFKYFFLNVFDKLDFKVPKRTKTHLYFEFSHGEEFCLEPLKNQLGQFILTSQRPGVKQHDYILVQSRSEIQSYEISEIEYYSDGFPDMWIAKLASVG